jgi:hypothetical protein
MKIVFFLAALISAPAFAGESTPIHSDSTEALMRCREGRVQFFRDDGRCRFGGTRDTLRRCVNGRYVIIRAWCRND